MSQERQRVLAIIGLGKMGGGLARHALSRGFRVCGFDKTEPRADLLEAGLEVLENLEQLREAIDAPRLAFLYLPAGDLVDETLNALSRILDRGDVVADGQFHQNGLQPAYHLALAAHHEAGPVQGDGPEFTASPIEQRHHLVFVRYVCLMRDRIRFASADLFHY
jgi:NAD binding domain of 6-phosphogluconate dehydrogenase